MDYTKSKILFGLFLVFSVKTLLFLCGKKLDFIFETDYVKLGVSKQGKIVSIEEKRFGK